MAILCRTTVPVLEVNQDPGLVTEPPKKLAKHRVFVADDQEEVLGTIASVLEPDFDVVGVAENGRDVLRLVPALHPEVLVLDVVMPGINGIEVALRLRATGSPAKVVFLTVHEDRDFVEAAMSAGAQAYVSKPHLETDLVVAIRSVLEGEMFISSSIQLMPYIVPF